MDSSGVCAHISCDETLVSARPRGHQNVFLFSTNITVKTLERVPSLNAKFFLGSSARVRGGQSRPRAAWRHGAARQREAASQETRGVRAVRRRRPARLRYDAERESVPRPRSRRTPRPIRLTSANPLPPSDRAGATRRRRAGRRVRRPGPRRVPQARRALRAEARRPVRRGARESPEPSRKARKNAAPRRRRTRVVRKVVRRRARRREPGPGHRPSQPRARFVEPRAPPTPRARLGGERRRRANGRGFEPAESRRRRRRRRRRRGGASVFGD